MFRRSQSFAILASLLIQVSGATAALAPAPQAPACCVRAAGHPHCAGMEQEAAPPPHRHSETMFFASAANCGCAMGLATSNSSVPAEKYLSLYASSSRLVVRGIDQQSPTSSPIPILGERGPPSA